MVSARNGIAPSTRALTHTEYLKSVNITLQHVPGGMAIYANGIYYVTVTPDYVFRVGDSLREDFQNGRSYYGLDGAKIALPDQQLWRPRREFLEWHQQNAFRG